MRVVGKVYAYVTQGKELLVFTHPYHPEAGIQVPGGSINPGEHPDDAVIRETCEETGFDEFYIVEKLGEVQRDMSDYGKQEIHHRHFYHLVRDEPLPERWRHGEFTPGDGTSPHVFAFYWAPLTHDFPPLIAEMDKFGYIIKEKVLSKNS